MVEKDVALDRALETTSLTHGHKPFHAVMTIGSTGQPYSGRIEVWWADAKHYKTELASPTFSQTRVVNGATQMETDTGDYYPRWLQNFVDGLLDPIPMAANFRNQDSYSTRSNMTANCLMRNDKPGGITDQMTWGQVCFWGDQPLIRSVLTMNYSINFTDFHSFHDQQIARAYTTSVLDYKRLPDSSLRWRILKGRLPRCSRSPRRLLPTDRFTLSSSPP